MGEVSTDSQPRCPSPSIPWSQGFELFCQGFSNAEIGRQLGCSQQAVSKAIKRMNWTAKRAHLVDKFPTLDPLAHYNPVAVHILNFQQREIERIENLESALLVDIRHPDPEIRCKVIASLNALAERRRIALQIPLPGSRRPDQDGGRKAARRGVVHPAIDLGPSAVTDVLVPPPAAPGAAPAAPDDGHPQGT